MSNGNTSWIVKAILPVLMSGLFLLGLAMWNTSADADKRLETEIKDVREKAVQKETYKADQRRLEENQERLEQKLDYVIELIKNTDG